MNSKGFTILEALIAAAIVGLLAVIILSIAKNINSDDKSWCKMYKYSNLSEVPITCFDYLTNTQEGSN